MHQQLTRAVHVDAEDGTAVAVAKVDERRGVYDDVRAMLHVDGAGDVGAERRWKVGNNRKNAQEGGKD
jgi:hypothetical protein